MFFGEKVKHWPFNNMGGLPVQPSRQSTFWLQSIFLDTLPSFWLICPAFINYNRWTLDGYPDRLFPKCIAAIYQNASAGVDLKCNQFSELQIRTGQWWMEGCTKRQVATLWSSVHCTGPYQELNSSSCCSFSARLFFRGATLILRLFRQKFSKRSIKWKLR